MDASESNGGVPGANSGFTRTCPDGTYRVKLATGDHFLSANDWEGGVYFNEWFQDAYCTDDATLVTVTEGGTTTANLDVGIGGTISGTITISAVPTAGASICATSTALGSCLVCDTSDVSGNYTLDVPPATDNRIEVFVSGEGTRCYDGIQNCTSFTPVNVTAGGTTPNIDVDFGCSTDDVDGDGVDECGGDCDDFNPNNFPGNFEVCDGQDNDCSG
ncbi:MAG: hypothetical protein GY728_13390, partial [Phycisphaeraceae bacterium]|nr:hypothetical protein [Phycisphaeraceae bacterium]